MSVNQFEANENQFIAIPPNMPPKLLVRFCELQKSFWNTFLHEVTEYYADELANEEPENPKTPVKETVQDIPNAPSKPRSTSRVAEDQEVPKVDRNLKYPEPVEKKKPTKSKKTKTAEEGPMADGAEPVEKKKPTKSKKTKTAEEGPMADGAEPEGVEQPVERKKRGPSEYNKFISGEVERLRREDPGLNHKVAFKMAVAAWKDRGNPTPSTTNETEPPSEPEVDPQNATLEEVC